MLSSHPSDALKKKAADLGFFLCSVAKAEPMDAEARRLEEWLNAGYHGKMGYMANHFELRTDPSKLVPGAKSMISLGYNYHNPQVAADPEAPRVSQYAYGEDYHKTIRRKLKELFRWVKEEYGDIQGRVFVDSGPVLERDWARRSGMGWIGKHTLLINRDVGSYFFLAELIIDLPLEPDPPIKDYCGTCTRCIDACPTEAISPSGYVLDGSKCISYLTIELREAIPTEFQGKLEGWAFGCDICQEVCPWNRFARRHHEPAFEPHPELLDMTQRDWMDMTAETFNTVFGRTPVKRAGWDKLMTTIGSRP